MIFKGNHVKFACFVLLAISEKAAIIRFSSRIPHLNLDYCGYHKNLIQ